MIRRGSAGADVALWQRVIGASVDGVFGTGTERATKDWQAAHGLEADGIVGPATLAAAQVKLADPDGLGFEFIEARGLYRGRSGRWRAVVIHTAECLELKGRARWIAEWFAGRFAPKFPAPDASAHYVVDADEVVQCVSERDRSWHAGGANEWSIGVEHAGYAGQSAQQWDDEYSRAELARSAELVAGICARWSIPVARLGPGELQQGQAGICGHVDVTNAYSGGRGHVDPGGSFPWSDYLAAVRSHA